MFSALAEIKRKGNPINDNSATGGADGFYFF